MLRFSLRKKTKSFDSRYGRVGQKPAEGGRAPTNDLTQESFIVPRGTISASKLRGFVALKLLLLHRHCLLDRNLREPSVAVGDAAFNDVEEGFVQRAGDGAGLAAAYGDLVD